MQSQLEHAMNTVENLKERDVIDEFAYMCMMNGIKKIYEAENAEESLDSDSEYEPSFIDDESIEDEVSDYEPHSNVTIAIIMQAMTRKEKVAIWLNGLCIGLMFGVLTQMMY